MNKKKECIVKKSKKTPINLHTSCNVLWYVHVTNEVSILDGLISILWGLILLFKTVS